jgi:hypothetical protein
MTQLDRMEAAVAALTRLDHQLCEIRSQLVSALDDAQNVPPNGTADGSVSSSTYNKYRVVERTLKALSFFWSGVRRQSEIVVPIWDIDGFTRELVSAIVEELDLTV